MFQGAETLNSIMLIIRHGVELFSEKPERGNVVFRTGEVEIQRRDGGF